MSAIAGFRRSITAVAALVAMASSLPVLAQAELPMDLVPARTIERFSVGSFLESIVAREDGTLIFVDHQSHSIYSWNAEDGLRLRARTDAELRGLGLDVEDALYATGRSSSGVETVFRIGADDEVVSWIEVPDGRFLNGMTMLEPGIFLVADSFSGLVWRADVRERTLDAWFRHEWTETNPENPDIPGPNGVKLYNGSVYLSNSALAKLIRIPIRRDGSAGDPELIVDDLVIDDFAFAANGDIYATTHIFNTVVVLRQDGSRAVIAGPAEGVTGSTAVAFGTTADDSEILYVVGDGGVFMPPETGVVAAELVALEVGEPGLSPADSLSWLERPDTSPGPAD